MSAEPVTGFGAGGASPYDHALRDGEPLAIHVADGGPTAVVDVRRFLGVADAVDRDLVAGLPGPLLDIGCGPGRIVAEALRSGTSALGVDISPAAVGLAHQRGIPVLHRSVFDHLPDEGGWGAVVLLDGNIGIGGDPQVLLARCAELLRPGGVVVVEAHPDAGADRTFEAVVVDQAGRRSLPFPWTESGVAALDGYARRAGLSRTRSWRRGMRTFATYAAR